MKYLYAIKCIQFGPLFISKGKLEFKKIIDIPTSFSTLDEVETYCEYNNLKENGNCLFFYEKIQISKFDTDYYKKEIIKLKKRIK